MFHTIWAILFITNKFVCFDVIYLGCWCRNC